MNQIRHEQWGVSRGSSTSRLLLTIEQANNDTLGSTVPQQQRGKEGFWERASAHERNNLFLEKTVPASHLRYKNGIILYLSMKGVSS